MPITRSRANPVTCFVTQHITSSGFDTTTTIACGQCCLICCETCFTMSALVRTRSSPAPGVHLAMWVGAQGRDRVQRTACPYRQPLLGATVGALLPRVAQ